MGLTAAMTDVCRLRGQSRAFWVIPVTLTGSGARARGKAGEGVPPAIRGECGGLPGAAAMVSSYRQAEGGAGGSFILPRVVAESTPIPTRMIAPTAIHIAGTLSR